jgi:hypothetical protein
MIWYSHWFIHPATAISTKRNGSSTDSVVVHSLSRALALAANYRQFKKFQFSVQTRSARFLLHILRGGPVRIRQFGFLANRARKKKLAAVPGAHRRPNGGWRHGQ